MNEVRKIIPVTSLMPDGSRDVAEFGFTSLYPQAEDTLRELLESGADFRAEGRSAMVSNELVEFSLYAVGPDMKLVVTESFGDDLPELISRFSETELSDAEIEEAVEILTSRWCFSTEFSACRTVPREAKYEEIINTLCELLTEVASDISASVSQIESTLIEFASQEESVHYA